MMMMLVSTTLPLDKYALEVKPSYGNKLIAQKLALPMRRNATCIYSVLVAAITMVQLWKNVVRLAMHAAISSMEKRAQNQMDLVIAWAHPRLVSCFAMPPKEFAHTKLSMQMVHISSLPSPMNRAKIQMSHALAALEQNFATPTHPRRRIAFQRQLTLASLEHQTFNSTRAQRIVTQSKRFVVRWTTILKGTFCVTTKDVFQRRFTIVKDAHAVEMLPSVVMDQTHLTSFASLFGIKLPGKYSNAQSTVLVINR
jgi:hypothetical protein